MGHTTGSEVAGIRVPEKHLETIHDIHDMLTQQSEPQKIIGAIATMLSRNDTNSFLPEHSYDGGVLSSSAANFEKRYQPDQFKVNTICNAMRELGHNIILTSGSFDIIHIGHAQYLESASKFGDFLVVGVDSDEKIRSRKGPNRPIVSEQERLRMLSHIRNVDLLTIKNEDDAKWQLVRVVRPHTLVATEGTYSDDEIKTLESAFVERVVVLPPQATTSTTARLRRIQMSQGEILRNKILDTLSEILDEDAFVQAENAVNQILGDSSGQ